VHCYLYILYYVIILILLPECFYLRV
jgi:hypothetical protein